MRVKSVSKKFKLYHEKRTSVYEVITNLTNRKQNYETLQVLDNVSFDIKKGEALGIIGRNGSGKTTLLRILSNIYKPDSGSVEVNGTIVPVLALGLGFHPELTAISNIYQSSILLGISKKQISQRVDKIIEYKDVFEALYSRLGLNDEEDLGVLSKKPWKNKGGGLFSRNSSDLQQRNSVRKGA